MDTTEHNPDERIEAAFATYRTSGDMAALARVFDRAAPQLLLLAAHVTPDAAAAEDLLQDTFLQALERAEQWDPDRPLLPWLAGILRHRAVDLARRLGRRRGVDLETAVEAAAASGPDPLQAATNDELLDRVRAALDALESPFREALVLRLVHGLEPTTIAHALGRPPATVRGQLKRGLERLRGALPATLAGALALLLLPGRGLLAVRSQILEVAGSAAAVASGASLAGAERASERATAGQAGEPGSQTGGGTVARPPVRPAVFGAAAIVAVGLTLAAVWWAGGNQPVPAGAGGVGPVADAAPGDGDARTGSRATGSDEATREAAPAGAASAGAASTLRGRIVRAGSGNPIPFGRATVSFSRGRFVTEDPEFRTYPDPVIATAGPDGRFAVTFVPEREVGVDLEVGAPGHVEVNCDWPSLQNGLDVDLGDVAIVRGCELRARVVDPDGRPLPGVTIDLDRRSGGLLASDSQFWMWSGIELESDTAGRLPMRMLPAPGRYEVSVNYHQPSLQIVEPRSLAVTATSESVLTPTIVVAPSPLEQSIVGRVVDERDMPVAGVTLCRHPEMLQLGHATSGADGRFWLGTESHGEELQLHVPATDRRFRLLEPERKYRRAAQDTVVRVVREPTFDVAIIVVDAATGQPIEAFGLRHELDYWVEEMALGIPNDRIYRPAPAAVHPGGRAEIEGLPRGRYRVSVFPARTEYATAYLVPFEVGERGAEMVRVELDRFVPVRVRVQTEGGEPVVGARVRLVHTMGTGGDFAALFSVEQLARGIGGGRDMAVALATATTDEQGRVELQAPVGESRLKLVVRGQRTGYHSESLPAIGRVGTERTIVVRELAIVRGVIGPREFGERAGPPPDALAAAAMVRPEDSDLLNYCPRVVLRRDDEIGGRGAMLPDGTFTIECARPGSWALMLGDLELGAVVGLQPGETRELELDATAHVPARVAGHVRVAGLPWTDGRLGFAAASGGSEDSALGPGGAFQVFLPRGRYLPFVSWRDEGGSHVLFDPNWLELRAGDDRTVQLAFEPIVLRAVLQNAAGEPVPDQPLRYRALDLAVDHHAVDGWCKAGPDGAFRLDPAPPGRLEFRLPGRDGAVIGVLTAPAAGAAAAAPLRLRLSR